MADLDDFDDIDALLSNSLKKAADPAPSAGVADAIRARVDAGDTGTPAASSTAPGWGAGSGGGFLPWLPWIGAVIAAGVIGGTIGTLGYAGHPVETVAPDTSALVRSSLLAEAPFAACPGGDAIGTLPAGAHVLAVQRDDASANVGIRDPFDVATTIWLPVQLVTPDKDEAAIASLPVGDPCPTIPPIETQTPTAVPVETQPPTQPTTPPTQPSQPPAPTDTTAPKINSMNGNPLLIINDQATVISVTAGDNVGVTGVVLTWSSPNPGGVSGSAQMTLSGGVWRYSYSNPNLSTGFGNITFKAQARDAAGNVSGQQQVVVNRQYLG